jgi:two-component system nitrogen regulation sensor histidine kinase NtrY
MPESKFRNHRLNEIIESQINSLQILDENLKIDYKNEIKDIKLKCDYNQLSRVFLNILKNSYESQTKSAKFISVKVLDGKRFIDIYIEDNGYGFPENRDKLFEPYITNKTDGTGLGLAICKKIIEDHGGEIYLLNSDDFGGASVRIKLYKV